MYALLTYGFPAILILFQWGLRTLLAVNAWAFIGPTLAATGLSFLVPLTRPKILNDSIDGAPGAIMISKKDNNFIPIVWFLLFCYLFAWALTCYFSLKLPTATILTIPTQIFIGLVAYVISLIATFVKERV